MKSALYEKTKIIFFSSECDQIWLLQKNFGPKWIFCVSNMNGKTYRLSYVLIILRVLCYLASLEMGLWILRFHKPCLTHWGRVPHICVSKLNIISSDNGLSPGWHQAIIWTNVGILLIGPLGTNFSEIAIDIHIHFHSRKCIWKYRLENGGHFVSTSMCW